MHHLLAGRLFILLLATSAIAVAEPLAHFPADGELGAATLTIGNAANLRYVDGRVGQGVYPPGATTIAVPVAEFNPASGTLMFWFRPDWSPPCYQAGMLVEVAAGEAWHLRFRCGYSHVPNHGYLQVGSGPDWGESQAVGSTAFGLFNLFTGSQWRHYAVRWDNDRGEIEVVVDGDTTGWRRGRFACTQTARLAASVLLPGSARGAFDEVRVYDRWLDNDELVEAAGLTTVATYLQEQQPPAGAPRVATGSREVSYVDPATGDTVTTTVGDTDSLYDPAAMPNLIETPHTKWARPLAGGPIKALLVVPATFYDERQTLLREGVELWQRLDMTCHMGNRWRPEFEDADYDVIVVSHQGIVGSQWAGWTALEPKLRDWIVRRVESGESGLVFAYPRNLDSQANGLFTDRVPGDPVVRGFPATAVHKAVCERYDPVYTIADDWYETPANLAENVVQVFQPHGGRVVRLNYEPGPGWGMHSGLTPDTAVNSAATLPQYDWYMALAARAVLYAAGREPAATITAVDPETWTVTVTGEAATIDYVARDIWGREYGRGEVAVAGDTVQLPDPGASPGVVVDMILRDGNGAVLDWYSAVAPPIPGLAIESLELDRDAWYRGEQVTGIATLDLTANSFPSTAPYDLAVYLTDHEGRRLRQVAGDVKTGRFAITIPQSSDSLLMRVEAVLRYRDRIVAARSVDCPVPRTEFPGFYAGMSGGLHNRAADRLRRQLFRDQFGVNTMLHSGKYSEAMAARDNITQIEYTTHLGYPTNEKTFKPWIEEWDDFFPEKLWCDPAQVVRFRPLFYSLGEEHFMLVSGSRHPLALARFQDYLRQRYGTIDTLNEVWGADFKAWDEIPMVKPDVVDVMKMDYSIQAFECRRFMEHLFAAKHAMLAQWWRRFDPHASVGIHVGWDLWMGRGYDYWLLSRGMDATMAYGGVHNQYCRSFYPHYYGSWWHYAIGDQREVRWHPWYMVMSGARGFLWYTQSCQIWGATTGDLQLSSDWIAAGPEFLAAANAGDLLSRTDYVQDQVAMHYSQASMHAGMGPGLSWAHEDLVNLLFDGGVPHKWLSYDQLAAGEASRYRLLILPGSICLSPGEVEAIRAHVARGGILWADRLPGTRDQFSRELPESLLADLFADLADVPEAPGLQVAPNGTVFLGNVGNYSYARNIGNHVPAQAMLDAIVRTAGIRRVGRAVAAAAGAAANGVWLAGYRQGAQHYLVACKDYRLVDRETAEVRLELDHTAHVYDSRAGAYLGYLDTIAATLEPTRGQLYACLPYRVEGIRLAPDTSWIRGRADRGEDLRVAVRFRVDGQMAADALHLLRVRVAAPDGSEVTSLRRLVPIRGGVGTIVLPVATNDPPGAYTLTATDVATGLAATARYRLK